MRVLDPILLRERRPPVPAGIALTLLLVVACTLLVYPLKHLTTVSSLGVVYLLGVVVVSTLWGLWLGAAMSVLSAAAFNFFHLPPVGRFTIADSRNWVALGAFLVVALASSWVSGVARTRAAEAMLRRQEADLTAESAQLLLERAGVGDALAAIGRRVAAAFALPAASIALGEVQADIRRQALPLMAGKTRVGTLLVPAGLPAGVLSRLRERIVPALAALLQVALERERLVAEAVQTEGLRRSDAVKTAVLRSVSHDLRSPVTAMIAAGAAVRAPVVTDTERDELGSLVVTEGERLSGMIDDLLDLSRLDAHAARPRLAECSVEEVIDAALAAQPAGAEVEVRLDSTVPPVRADFAQIERALANLLANAIRFAAGEPVVVRVRVVEGWVTIRVVDRGPGISVADQQRIFEPFYRAPSRQEAAGGGSGLGLAIAKGFVETNGGHIRVESVPGQGSTFVVALPTMVEAGA